MSEKTRIGKGFVWGAAGRRQWVLLVWLSLLISGAGQFRNDTAQYALTMERNEADLTTYLESHPDVELVRYPERALFDADQYRFDYPRVEEFRLNIIMDPCKGKKPDCCMNVFGTAEYPKLKLNGLEPTRVQPKNVLANDSDILANVDLVYEDGSLVPADAMRGADDELVIDYECDAREVPYSRCRGKNYANRRSDDRPACLDYNQTIDVMAGCMTPEGKHMDYCVQVAYTQNAFVGLCDGEYADDSHCGTFLEVHQIQGTPYYPEDFVIAEAKITTRDVSGFYTTTLNLTHNTFPGMPKVQNAPAGAKIERVMCTYFEPFIRVGSSVYVTNEGNTPSCCCPKPFKSATRVGSFQCPIGATGVGAYAAYYKTLKEVVETEPVTLLYPRCPTGLEGEDSFMCGAIDPHHKIGYTRPCGSVYEVDTGWTSDDLDGAEYAGQCGIDLGGGNGFYEYFPNCALTLEMVDPVTKAMKCKMEDLLYTFIGRVGRVTAVDRTTDPAIIDVTFNDGRTSYKFKEDMLKLETGKSMYEVWWVVRTQSEFVVQKRKGFNITSPQCTFDATNDRYFPYTILVNDIPLDTLVLD